MEILDEIVSEFLVESYESLDQLDKDLLALEETSDDSECLSSIFRTIHTIKGTSGFLAFGKLERLTHAGESLLVQLRDGNLTLHSLIADALLEMVNSVRRILRNIENGHGEGETSYDELIVQLEALKTGQAPPTVEIQPDEVIAELSSTKNPGSTPEQSVGSGVSSTGLRTDSQADTGLESNSFDDRAVLHQQDSGSSDFDAPSALLSDSSEFRGTSIADSTVRIDVQLLDKLMNLVGELVLARNQIMQHSEASVDTGLLNAAQRINLITSELQEGVMKTRMQPIRNAWSKLPRVIRDLSHACGKNVKLQMEGADTELDKTILEAIRDPLTHIVRNSVDHGIESPIERRAAGKPHEGTLRLSACHEGGLIVIEIRDDGAGINTDRVRSSAIRKGLISEDEAADMTEREAIQLILRPGFSTAESVTNISGRGVGMDVVKSNVEKIGGTLEIQSVSGQGTTLRIKIPLTLAIVPALVVTVEGDRYCIPQVNLLELVRLHGACVEQEIEVLHSVPVYRLRGRLLPLIYLDEELALRPPRTHQERLASESVNIVVLHAEGRSFGLIVDEINDTQEIVVKPLGTHLKSLSVYAGSTIMGDGAVSLILDVPGIAQHAHLLNDAAATKNLDACVAKNDNSTQDSWLIVEPTQGSQAAIRLSSVARLEEIHTSDIEQIGHRQVIQYRGEIMPLASISEYGQIEPVDGRVSIVVYNHDGRNVGVGVGRIVDIVNQAINDSECDDDTKIISGRVTQVIDLGRVTAGA